MIKYQILEIDHFKSARLLTLDKYSSNDIQFNFSIKQDGQIKLKKYEFQLLQFKKDIQKRYQPTSELQKYHLKSQQFGDICIQEMESFFKYLQTGYLCIERDNLLCYILMALHFQCKFFFAAFDAEVYSNLTSNKELSLLLVNLLNNFEFIRESENKDLKDIIGILTKKGIDLFIDRDIIDSDTIKLMSDKQFNNYIQQLSFDKKNAVQIKNYCNFVQTFYKLKNLDSLELAQKVDVLLQIINHIQLKEGILYLLAGSITAETILIFMEYLSEKALLSNLKSMDEDQLQIASYSERFIQEYQLELDDLNQQILQAKNEVQHKNEMITFLKKYNGNIQ